MDMKKWGVWILTTFVVGNMVGGGVFMLPSNLAQVAGPLGSTAAWGVTGLGVLMIALVFGNLATRKPELKAGPQSYAQALFTSEKVGKIAGYSIAWGYWAANWAATASVIISFAGYLSTFFPVMSSTKILFTVGTLSVEVGKLVTFLVCSLVLWGIQTILTKNINNAGKMNVLATVAKIVGFGLFIILIVFVFDASNLGGNQSFVKDGTTFSLGSQVNAAAIATLWAFIGIESAVMLSNRATSQRAVKTATLLGLLLAMIIYVAITLLTMGALSQEELRLSQKPLVDALAAVVGDKSAAVMAILALISLFGSTVGWIMVSAEVPYQAAKTGLFPPFFGVTNKNGSPIRSLTVTNIMTQVFLFSTISASVAQAYNFAIVVATLAYLIPYLVSAIYQCKLVLTGETYDIHKGARIRDGIIAGLALVYSVWVIKTGTANLKTFFLGIGLFVLGIVLYPLLMRTDKNNNM